MYQKFSHYHIVHMERADVENKFLIARDHLAKYVYVSIVLISPFVKRKKMLT